MYDVSNLLGLETCDICFMPGEETRYAFVELTAEYCFFLMPSLHGWTWNIIRVNMKHHLYASDL